MPDQKLPVPRLQLRWAEASEEHGYPWACHYELVLPLCKHDIRREVYDEEGELVGEQDELAIPFKEPTLRDCDGVPCTSPDGSRYCDAPFRDGAHAGWDASVLGNLPIYVVAPDGIAFRKE